MRCRRPHRTSPRRHAQPLVLIGALIILAYMIAEFLGCASDAARALVDVCASQLMVSSSALEKNVSIVSARSPEYSVCITASKCACGRCGSLEDGCAHSVRGDRSPQRSSGL